MVNSSCKLKAEPTLTNGTSLHPRSWNYEDVAYIIIQPNLPKKMNYFIASLEVSFFLFCYVFGLKLGKFNVLCLPN